ncbi:hypothetical protein [Pseudoalteromonas byunsanensis]|uniref:DUF3592 domain-containing protein n=1 Tax=Pseudoalteromonas byunsanensis TaxID=327939 RepID=A0A1S1NAV1_9GAMM|nr:hypothetical protein [Pseudoalteromonas byunsanensis]OHU96574.1 hypothetical protein BIW53_04390 [Pseudoalteromonas byunsanensis]
MLALSVSVALSIAIIIVAIALSKKKRQWRQVQVEGVTKVKQHTAGPIEMLGASSLLVEFTYDDKKYSCQTAFNQSLYDSFCAKKPTYIFIDPNNPSQCLDNVYEKSRYVKLWLILTLLMIICISFSYL